MSPDSLPAIPEVFLRTIIDDFQMGLAKRSLEFA
jgi:hypothetical protein